MKHSLIENILTGFRTAHDARTAANQLRKVHNVLSAVHYDGDHDARVPIGSGHCVRLAMIQDDAKTGASLEYHRVQVAALEKAHVYAVDMEQNEWEACNRSAADSWHEIAQGLDSALECHRQFVTDLEPLTCNACGRGELECSQNPCADVIADRIS